MNKRHLSLHAVSGRNEARGRGCRVSSLFVRRIAIAITGAAACFTVSESASAQEWLKDRQNTEGAGVRAGDFEFHPGIGLQGGYDSNYFLRTNNAGFVNSGVQATPELLVTPSISLSTLGGQRTEGQTGADMQNVSFRATASGTYREFFGQLTPEQRNGSVDAAATLSILPGHPWGAVIKATYDRIIQPSPFGDPDLAFTRDVLGGSAELVMQPGSGTLDWRFGANVAGTLFEDTGGLGYNNIGIGAYTRGRWKFRPKTALLYDASFGFSTYTDSTAGAGEITQLHSSDPVRTRIGINGLITPRVSLLAMVGYGGSFFSPGSDPHVEQYDSVIGNGEVKIFLSEPPGEIGGGISLSQSSLTFGYTRDFSTSYLSDFYGLDRGYVKFAYYFAGRAVITLEGGGAAVEYPELFLPTTTHSAFTDARIDGTLYGEYRFTNSFGLNATLRYTTNLSSAQLNITPAGAGPTEEFSMQWQRIEAYLGVRLFL